MVVNIMLLRRELKKFADAYIDSFVKWDLVISVANRNGELFSVSKITEQLAKKERKEKVEAAVKDFAHKGFLLRRSSPEEPQLFLPNPSYLTLMHDFADASETRDGRSLILAEVLYNMRRKKEGGQDVMETTKEKNNSQEKCWEIVHKTSPIGTSCPDCQAYLEKKQCWDVEDKPCTNSPAVCILINCPAYLEYKDEIEEKLADKDLLEAIEDVEIVAEKKCWELNACSPKTVSACSIQENKGNCWETASCMCTTKQKAGCECCPIYIFHVLYDQRGLTL